MDERLESMFPAHVMEWTGSADCDNNEQKSAGIRVLQVTDSQVGRVEILLDMGDKHFHVAFALEAFQNAVEALRVRKKSITRPVAPS